MISLAVFQSFISLGSRHLAFHKCNSVILSFESNIFTNVKFEFDREYLGNLRAVIRSRKFNCTGVLAQSFA